MQQLTISLLGAPSIAVDGGPIRVDTRKAIAMVAYLALNPGPHSREALATLLWPDLNQARALAALRRTLSVLNRCVISPWLTIDRSNVELRIDQSVDLDVAAFHRGVVECDEHGHGADVACARCVAPLTDAVNLYRDDFLAGFSLRDSVNFDDWQFFTAEELREHFVDTLDRLVQALVIGEQYAPAIDRARRRLQADPLHEAAHRQLMRLFVWADQRNAALRQYRECVRILDEELGVPPLEETTALYEDIYANRAIPKPTIVVAEQSETIPPARSESAPNQAAIATDLVGRESAWTAIERALGATENGHLVIVEGEAGIGKTALIDGLLGAVAGRQRVTLSSACYYGELELAYAPIRDLLRKAMAYDGAEARLADVPAQWLADAARLLPDLATETMAPLPDPGTDGFSAKGRFFEAVCQVLGALTKAPLPAVIAIDNVQWADSASLDLLGYLARRLADLRLCLVLTWRSEQLADNSRHQRLFHEVARSVTSTEISLDRLTQDEVERFLISTPLAALNQAGRLVERLLAESDGIPLFLVEYVQLLVRSPDLIEQENWALPSGIRDLLQSRLDPVSDAGRQLLTAAAVIGRSFEYDTVRAVSGRSDEECVVALEELLAHRLVREGAGSVYDFYHDQLRGLVYADISRARRRLLHRRVADALITLSRRSSQDPRTFAASLAYHFAEGDQIEQAIVAYIDATEQAALVFANHEAIRYLERALALGSDEAAAIHERLGDLRTLLGEYIQARNDYEAAAAMAQTADTSRLECKLGDLHHRLGNLDLAQGHYAAAVEDTDLDQAWRCRALAQWSLVAEQAGDRKLAAGLARDSLVASEEAGDLSVVAYAYNVLSILARHADQIDQAMDYARQSLEVATQSRTPTARVAALNSLALAFAAAGEHGEAITLTDEALAIATTQGDRHRAAALHDHLADYYHAMGNDVVAAEQVKLAVQIFAEISADGLDLNPAIWKLEEW